MRNLILVAHPDDETIWMGGTILRNPNTEWLIISMCRKHDKDRCPKFKRVCKKLKAHSIISDLDDEKLKSLSINSISKKIKKVLPKNQFDSIYTHGLNGEYGHIRHKEIHRAIKKLLKEKELKCKRALFFSYKRGKQKVPNNSELIIPTPSEKSDLKIRLSRINFKKKIDLINKIYGFSKDSFEVLSCSKIETFKIY